MSTVVYSPFECKVMNALRTTIVLACIHDSVGVAAVRRLHMDDPNFIDGLPFKSVKLANAIRRGTEVVDPILDAAAEWIGLECIKSVKPIYADAGWRSLCEAVIEDPEIGGEIDWGQL